MKGLGQLKISNFFKYFWFSHILWVYLTRKTCGQHQFTSLNILGHPRLGVHQKFVQPKWTTVICPWTRKSSVRSLLQKMVIKCFTSWLSCLQRLTKWSKYLVTLWTFIHRKCLKCLDFLKWWKDKFQMQTGLSSCRLSSLSRVYFVLKKILNPVRAEINIFL